MHGGELAFQGVSKPVQIALKEAHGVLETYKLSMAHRQTEELSTPLFITISIDKTIFLQMMTQENSSDCHMEEYQ